MTKKEALKAWEKMYTEIDKENGLFVGTINPEMVSLAIKALEAQGWIPVKTRELSAEEVKEVNEKYDVDLDGDEAWCICSPLPEETQEVLITTKYGDVVLTEFCVDDVDGCCFDGYEDRGDVLAWMPLPKPYTKENDT